MSEEKNFTNSLRLCHIYKWDSFDGYGFNLHAEKGKPGQFIGKVDDGSPAEAAGLKEGDRIIEVNSVNIANENHKQVVQRIKALPDVATLLVVDPEGDSYYRSKNIVLKSTLSFVVHMQNPPETSAKIGFNEKNCDDTQSQKSTKSAQSCENETGSMLSPCLISTGSNENMQNDNMGMDLNNQNNSLNLNMTAKELRAQLAAKKKYDPKKDHTIDFKKKSRGQRRFRRRRGSAYVFR